MLPGTNVDPQSSIPANPMDRLKGQWVRTEWPRSDGGGDIYPCMLVLDIKQDPQRRETFNVVVLDSEGELHELECVGIDLYQFLNDLRFRNRRKSRLTVFDVDYVRHGSLLIREDP